MRFREVIEGLGETIELDRAALLLAGLEYPDLDVDPWLQRLDEMGAEVARRISGVSGDYERLEALTRFLYRDVGLRGNTDDYYDPRNSFLNDVLERKLGIPISLAVILIEVGRRAEIPLLGVALPGHFVVRHVRHTELLLNPFDEGRILTRVECADIVSRVLRTEVPLSPQMLRPVGPREVLARMHHNLRAIYLQKQDLRRLKRVIERLVLLEPEDLNHWRDRGVFRIHAGDAEGLEDLEHYLEQADEVSDREEVEKLLTEARRKLAAVH
ncbi:MAG: transglutaminase-like domain-containing protein [Acidobacteriota bacterium]